MRFTKLGHSCVRLDKDGAVLVIDPGTFSDAAAALDGATAVMVTHEHPDHLDADAIRAALSSDPGLTLWANSSICAQFGEFGDRVHEVQHGDALEVAGFSVHVYGVDHALIHRDIPLVVNTGFLVEGELFHPGDSFTDPRRSRLDAAPPDQRPVAEGRGDDRLLPRGRARPRLRDPRRDPERGRARPDDQDDVRGRRPRRRARRPARTRNHPGPDHLIHSNRNQPGPDHLIRLSRTSADQLRRDRIEHRTASNSRSKRT